MTASVATARTHADDVERFYSHGAAERAREADGFLSFGLWQRESDDYLAAAENLLAYVLDRAALRSVDRLLNVSCGNGAETVRICRRLQPKHLRAVDITTAHVETARRKLAEAGLQGDLRVERMDACRTEFPDRSFTHVIGIEGPAHFDTRELFLRECGRLLVPGGVLVLTDSIAGEAYPQRPGSLTGRISNWAAELWQVPAANRIPIATYRKQLESAGFDVEILESIGDRVFPGFADWNVRREAVREAIRARGVSIGLGLTFISWLLGYASRHRMIDYVFVKAVRRADGGTP